MLFGKFRRVMAAAAVMLTVLIISGCGGSHKTAVRKDNGDISVPTEGGYTESGYYVSSTNPALSTDVDTALVVINGEKYIMNGSGMKLNYADTVTYVYLTDIADQYTVNIEFGGIFRQLADGFTNNEFKSATVYIGLEDFYDWSEKDEWGMTNYFAGNLLSNGVDAGYFKTTEMTVEHYDTSGITAMYFHIVTQGPSSGKSYDIEVLSVSDFSDDVPGDRPVVCAGCGGTGSCIGCSGTGHNKYYDAVTHSMKYKECTVCKGTGKCSICKGTGEP